MKHFYTLAVEWFLNQHTLAKVAWVLGVVFLLLLIAPFGIDFDIISGTTDARTERAAESVTKLDSDERRAIKPRRRKARKMRTARPDDEDSDFSDEDRNPEDERDTDEDDRDFDRDTDRDN